MNLPNQALKLMDQSLLVVLSHGGHYDQAAALMLFVQCKVASVATAEAEVRNEVIADGIRLLGKVKQDFNHMEAFTKVKDAVYLQVLSRYILMGSGGTNKKLNKYVSFSQSPMSR